MWEQQKESRARLYDQVNVCLPKGRLRSVKNFAASQGKSVNGLINELLQQAMGIDGEDWQGKRSA